MSTTPLAAKEPVAIIGTGCRFPGSTSSPSKLWELLNAPYDLRKKLPDSRFNPEGVYHPDNKHHGTSNVKHSYTLDEDHRAFDHQFFAIKPAEASSMDPQQRHLLEVVYEGLEAAGQKIENLRGSSTAVYVGLMYGEYGEMLAQQPDEIPTYMATGTARSIIANRLSYFFDWHGPSMTIDTACSSSLVALHHAVQSLRSGESPIAIAAGSNLCLGPESYIAESKLQMLSPNGRSRMWDADADGYARGDGVAAVVLKLLKDAIADGDDIECIIRETAVNQDGRTRGITMPSSQAQTDLIHKTYARAGLNLNDPADRPQYFEAHGTGTPAGDPIEAEAIHEAFFGNDKNDENQSKLYVGSIKSIIGHTEGTAGLAGVIKASLAIQNKTIPPNLWFHQLNPAIQPFYTHLQVPTKPINWPGDASAVRRASVNSFGFGGTNAHAILESVPHQNYDNSITKQPELPFSPLTFSAHTEAALLATLSQYVQHIKDGHALDAQGLVHILNSHRSRFEYRYAFGIDPKQTLLENLESNIKSLQSKTTQVSSKTIKPESTRILGVFTGQGAQYAGMIRELYLRSPQIRQTVEEFNTILGQLPETLRPAWSLSEELLKTGKDSRVGEAAISQPLSTVVQIILVDLLRAAGIQFSTVVGHSSGEIVASYAAGFLLAADAVRIAYLRGLVTSKTSTTGQPGRMLAVSTSYEDATELCNLPEFEGRLCIAAVNSSSSLTLSGDLDAVDGVKDILEDEEKFARLLKVDKAYHSHHMLEFAEAYLNLLREQDIPIQKPPPGSPLWVSSVDLESFNEAPPDLSSGYWVRNLTHPVLFYQAITKAVVDLEAVHATIEIGPHPALQAPASQTIQENIEGEDVIPYIGVLRRGQDASKAFADGIAKLWTTLGLASKINLRDLEQFLTQSKDTKIIKNLPTYPWMHERIFWHEARESKIRRARSKRPNMLLGHRSTEDPGQQFRWRNILTPREIPWLADHRIQGQRCFPAAGYVAAAIEAAAALSQDNEMLLIELQNIVLGAALNFDDDDSRVSVLFTVTDIDHVHEQDSSILTSKFEYFSAPSTDAGPMILNAEGRLIIHYGPGSKDTLPQTGEFGPGFSDVDHDRFYESMVPLGYGYTGPFRALSSLKRKLGAVNGIVSQPASEDQTLIVHPAMLDCTIQSVLLAYSYPGDGRLWSLHIPTRIGNVLVNPQLSAATQTIPVRHYTFDTTLVDTEDLGVTGNISVYATGGQMLLRMEGMQAIPLERAQVENDRKLFSKVVWDVANPDAVKAVRGEKASHFDYKMAELLERVSHFYLRRLDNAFPATDPIRNDGPWVGMLGFARQIVESVQQGTHVCARADWVDDDEKIIEAEIRKVPETIDLKIARIIGKNIISVVRGETTMLEHLRTGDTLDDYYANAMGIHYTEYMARLAKQLSFKKPDLNFLEIGAGTGAATKSIFREIGKSYKTYTFTDISSGFFEAAQHTFSDHLSSMLFETLDVEKDIEEQGYKPHSYDVIVASLVVHATHNLKDTLTRIRQLLKPGGYLLLLELTNLNLARISFIFGSLPGWWLGEEPNRRYNPCVTTQQWGELLLESGFSGVDTATTDQDALPFPASVIVSQAVNDEVSFLREPLNSPRELQTPQISQSLLLIIGGRSKQASQFSRVIKGLTTQYFDRGILEVDTVERLQATDFDPSGTTVLFLADLDKNVFESLDRHRFEGLKTLFNHATRVVWVTKEAKDNNPYHLMSIGFGRSMSMELPHVQTQYIDLAKVSASVALTVAEMLLRFDALTSTETFTSEQILWPVEPEISVDAEKQFIHRIVHDAEKNYRYNSIRREITLDTLVDAENPVEISLGRGGYRLVPQRPHSNQDERKVVQTLVSTLTAVKLDDTSSLHVGLGIFNSKPVAYLSDSIATRVAAFEELAVESKEVSPQFLGTLTAALVAGAVVHTASDYIVVVEPEEELAFAIRAHASSKPISLVFLTTDAKKVQPHYHYVHSSIGIFDLDLIIPRGVRRILLTGSSSQVESRIKTWAQSRKIEVASLAPSAEPYRSPRSSLVYLQSLLKSSILIADKLQRSNIEVSTLQDLAKSSPKKSHDLKIQIVDFRPIKAAVSIEPVDKYPLLRGDRTYWLVGLSRSLGLSLCNWMIDRGAKNVVISSRSPVVDKAALNALRNKGANVQVIPCNIVEKQSVVAAHRLIQSTMPPIAGVANGAMVLRDTMLDDMTVDDMNAVIHPKVTGSINLNDLFVNTQLDFFIFLSSAIGMTGNVGQCNYAAANIFMHGLAAKRRKNGLAASVMVIGVILGVGYVTRETSQSLQDNLKKSGHNWLSEKDFHILFAEAIRDGSAASTYQSEIIVGIKSIRLETDHIPPWANNPRFSHFILQSEDGVTTFSTSTEKVSLRNKFLEATSKQEIYNVFRDELVDHVISMLRMDDSVPKEQFLQYTAGTLGIDSLNAVDLRTWFLKEAKIDVPVLRILGGASLGDLLDFALDLLPDDVAPAKSPDYKPNSKPNGSSAPIPAKAKSIEASAQIPSYTEPVRVSALLPPDDSAKSTTLAYQAPGPKPEDSPVLPNPSVNDGSTEKHIHPAPASSTSDSASDESFSVIDNLAPSSASSQKNSEYVNILKERPGADAEQILRSEKLSRGQSRFWFLQSYVEDPTTFNITCLFKLQGTIDAAKLEKAVNSIGRRHEALRTSINDHVHETVEQHILKEAKLFLETQAWFTPADIQLRYEELKGHSYDLARGALMRIILLSPQQSSTQDYYLLIGYHHINMDGVSLEIILKELEEVYSGRSLDKEPFQFPEYAGYEEKKLSNGEWDQSLEYWKEKLGQPPDVFPVLPFGQAGMRQAIRTYSHVKKHLIIESDTKKLIQRACRTYKASPYHFYLATYLTLLARWAEAPEVCIGSSYANRHDSNRQTSVGHYLNPVGLRLPYDGKKTFVSALETARQISSEASLHSEVPFDVLLDHLKVERNPVFSPVFQTFINYRPRTDESRPFGTSTLTGVEYESGKTPYDVMLDVFDGQHDESRIEISLQRYLYSEDAVDTLAKSYLSLVKAFARNPMQALDNAPLHSDGDLRNVAKIGKGPTLKSSWGSTVIHRLEDLYKAHSSKPAIQHRIEDTLTFGDMANRVNRIYEALSVAGVAVGLPVGVHMQASADWICSILAIIKYGSIYVPLDFRQGKTRLVAIIKECQPAAILVDGQTFAPAEDLTSGGKIQRINLTNIVGSARNPTPILAHASDQAAYYYTSGSTGTPKGIPLTNEGILSHMEGMSDRLKVSPSDVMLQQTAFSFDFSLWQILIALTNAASIVIVPDHLRRDAVGIVDLIVKSKVTMTATTPSEYTSWLRYGSSKLRESAWRYILCGGEPMPHSFLEDLWALGKSDLKLEHLYGPTEVSFIATTGHLDYSKEYAVIPIGRPIANYTIVILDKNGQALPAGVLGEIAIGSLSVSTQYLNRPEESQQKFRSRIPALERNGVPPTRFHLTGDEGWLSSEGLLYISGRIAGDTQIKLRGQRLDLLDVEQAIVSAASGSILEANVSASRDANGADFLVAQVVLRQDAFEIDLPELATSLPLQQFMRPSVIFAVDKFPVTGHGKRDRRALASVDVSKIKKPKKITSITLNPEQQRVFSIWKDILPKETVKLHDIGPETDFFAIGGTSLTILELQKRFQRDLGARLEIATLFESSSLRQMTVLLEEQTQLTKSEEKRIDWEKETQLDLSAGQFRNAKTMKDWTTSSSNGGSIVVILTGATGFLGKALLRTLVATKEVAKVHCLAVRQVEKLSDFADDPTVRIHRGDLTSPRLGLSEEDAQDIFSESHIIIHNGADVSFLKTYASLRQANVQSTRELIKLSLTHVDGGLDFHFVSTAGVLGFSGEREFPNITASGFQPPVDGSFGYSSSKWASERILERASDAYGFPVSIYRPTNITGDQTPELDLVHNVIKYSQILKVVPDPKGIWDGYINLVSLEICTTDIISSLLYVAYGRDPGVRYLHLTGPEDIPVNGLKSHLERNDRAGAWYKQVGLAQWVAKAERAGLKPLTGAYLKKLAAEKQELYLTRVLKEKSTPDQSPSEKSSSWNVLNSWRRTKT